MNTIIQFCILMGGTIGLAIIFGTYIARMISFEMRPLEKTLAKVESGFYKILGINVTRQMSWKEYFFALFLMDSVVLIFVVIILTLQNYMPLSEGKDGLSIDLAFNIAIGFIADTDLQHYVGDQQLSNFSQMIAINIYHVCSTCFRNCSCICIHSLVYKKKFWSWKFLYGFYKDYSYPSLARCISFITYIDDNRCTTNSKFTY